MPAPSGAFLSTAAAARTALCRTLGSSSTSNARSAHHLLPPALASAARAFSSSLSTSQRSRTAGRPAPPPSRAMGGLPPPRPRTRSGMLEDDSAVYQRPLADGRSPIGRITPVKVPAGQALPGTPGEVEGDQRPEFAFASLHDEQELRNARPNVWRPVLWSVMTVGTIYAGAALWTNEDTEEWAEKLGAGSFWRRSVPTQKEMMDAKRLELMKDLQETVGGLQKALSGLPTVLSAPVLHGYVAVAENWLNTSEAKRFAAVAISINALVFIGWRVPRLSRVMKEAWTHSPLSGKSYTLLTSAFSHAEFWHFGFNMFALWSFSPMAFSFLVHGDRAALSSFPSIPESTAIYHLAAFYIAAAVFASLGSHLHASLVSLPRFLARVARPPALAKAELLKLARAHQLTGTIGASGALYAVMAVGTLAFPHAQVGIVFLPFLAFPITWAVGCLCLLDLVGLVRGWQVFNHAAHLSGAAFGALYWRYGCDLWDWLRSVLRPSSAPSKRGPAQLI